ncbi:hypothetical protein [Glycomyces albidus]|uniref:Uncharacterized protein n=1 Tax=Glycomyces albidus TaxID=2656774 RepID=A0A6L5G7M6_9ACTN|nr:hypothetical protein [Glycomyces albidus]MQM25649.1 hypothetical protein [Glycomyces albidus]
MTAPQDQPLTPPRLTTEYVEAILDRVRDYALCSDLRMYAWARRRRAENAGEDPAAIEYKKSVERYKTEDAEDAFEALQEFLNKLTTGQPPALADDNEEPITDSLREQFARTDSAVAERGVPDDVLAPLAAVGVVVSAWRNTLEPWHYLFTDAQMSWMSLIATRDIAPHMNPATNTPDFTAIEQVLCDGDRLVLPGIPAHDVLGPAWPSIATRIAAHVRRYQEDEYTTRVLANWGGMAGSRWWGRPEAHAKGSFEGIVVAVSCDIMKGIGLRARIVTGEEIVPWLMPQRGFSRAQLTFQREGRGRLLRRTRRVRGRAAATSPNSRAGFEWQV